MRNTHASVFPKKLLTVVKHQQTDIRVADDVLQAAGLSDAQLYETWKTGPAGLTNKEARVRRKIYGPNVLAKDERLSLTQLLWRAAINPLVLLLAALATLSLFSGDLRAAVMMGLMIAIGVSLKWMQEARADSAAAKLKAMISVKATVMRHGKAHELPLAQLVPGDLVTLSAGDMIPADLRLICAKDLFVTQSALTGESLPVEKTEIPQLQPSALPSELHCIAFLGTSVDSGSATGVVIATGKKSFLGSMAASLVSESETTAFDRGISQFTWLMLRFVIAMVAVVFLINGLTKGNWGEAFFFAIAVAVGLTPEMLPMIVTVCLSKGAIAMSRKKVIVKRLDSIQNLGAMDVLCTDKTGTLTVDRVVLEKHCDVLLQEDDGVLALAYMNSHFQTGLKNVLDRAILAHSETHTRAQLQDFTKVDEIPFNFQRRIMSVVVRTPQGLDRIIAKGAPEEIFSRCASFEIEGTLYPMDHAHMADLKRELEQLLAEGFRVLAVASKEITPRGVVAGDATPYTVRDESELILNGYVAFFDPPKESARAAIEALQQHGVAVKVLTGDNDLVAQKICKEVGLPIEHVLLGPEIEAMSDEQLAEVVLQTTLFARVTPAHKQRILRALQAHQHIVGFLGDGINDAPALRTADVGISVDSAVDIAKESADMILLEKSLLVLEAGVVEGRKVFANILKYVRMGASSNFGNMFSVLGASLFVPYLPMTPIQILANNLLYDISQTAIPTDDVDPEQIEKPRPWDIRELTRFIVFIGPCSSIFDYTTYFIMLTVFGCWNTSTPAAAAQSQHLFQTGWFVESLITQTLIIHIIRTSRIPFLQSRASLPLILISLAIVSIAITLPYWTLGETLGLVPLPPLYWPLLIISVLLYALLTQLVKTWLLRKQWIGN